MSYSVQAKIVPYGSRYKLYIEEIGSPPPGLSGRLSVSRVPDHSFYELGNLAKHNGDGPAFQAISGARALADRIYKDVERVLAGQDPSTDLELTARGPIWPAKGNPPGVTEFSKTAVNANAVVEV